MTAGVPCPRCKRRTADGLVCHRCLGEFDRALEDLAVYLPSLAATVQRRDDVARGVVHLGELEALNDVQARERAEVDAETRKVPAMLRSVSGVVALPAHPLPVNLDAAALHADTAWLRQPGVLAGLARQRDGLRRGDGEYIDVLVRLARRIEWAIDRRDPEVYLGKCGAPDVKAELAGGVIAVATDRVCGAEVYARSGDSITECGRCGGRYRVGERKAWLRGEMRDVWARPARIAACLTSWDLPLSANTLDQWISRDRRRWRPERPWLFPYPPILQVGIDSDEVDGQGRALGKPLYRFGDVLERVEWLRAQRQVEADEAVR